VRRTARIATADDWPEIEALLRAMGFTEGQSSEAIGARFSELVERTDHFICVAERNGLVGYAWAQDFGPHLRSGQSVAKLHDLFGPTPAEDDVHPFYEIDFG
jgi:hypothetical protein